MLCYPPLTSLMDHFIVQPDWYSHVVPAEANGTAQQQPGAGLGLRSLPDDDVWRSPWVEVAEKHPHPRFEHSCCLIGSTMYLFGGNTSAHPFLIAPPISSQPIAQPNSTFIE